ncbi:hypothetical protein B4144_1100 [Bacillus atrophaeus]|nr:hypothetical protein B4144_1100 [Bacillus atrophaeus]
MGAIRNSSCLYQHEDGKVRETSLFGTVEFDTDYVHHEQLWW